MGQDISVNDANGGNESGRLYAVVCIHCEKKVFRFSDSYLADCGEVVLACPGCGGITRVTGNGEISAG